MKMRDERESFILPFLSLGAIAILSGLTRDTVYWLIQKGCLTPHQNSEGKMVCKTNDVLRWMKEANR